MRFAILVFSFLFAFSFYSSKVYAEGNVENGAKLFKKNCKICHKKDGSKSKLSKAIKGLKFEQVSNAIKGEAKEVSKKYKMMVKSMKKKKFSDQDIEDMTAFLNK